MLTLRVEVPEGRDRTAYASLHDSLKTFASGPAVASALSSYAAAHANPECDPLRLCGHPPLGRYRLVHHEAAPVKAQHYGSHILLFEPQSGPALEAESFGRLGLLVFGGQPGRRTQGGLRVENELLKKIVARIKEGNEIALNVVAFRPRAWWQFWKSASPPSQALSGLLNPPQPPYDELTLLEALLQKVPRRPRGAGGGTSDYDPDRYRSSRDNESYDRSSSGDSFQAGGGQSGGGGASGSWDAPGSGRGPGTDNTGRIVGAAVAVGAVAAAAAMASHGRDADAGGSSGGSGGGGSDAFSGASADTGTSTAY